MSDGADSPAVSVVVPLFNEEENVPILQSELTGALSGLDYEIIFVDDGSSDHTVEQITPGPGIAFCDSKKCRTGAALYAGLRSARGRTAVLIDGDLQNDPADILKLLAETSAAPIWFAGIARSGRIRFLKRVTSRIANLSQQIHEGRRSRYGCTFEAMRRECISAASIQGCIGSFPRWRRGYRLSRFLNHRHGNTARASMAGNAPFARPWTCSVCAGSLPST